MLNISLAPDNLSLPRKRDFIAGGMILISLFEIHVSVLEILKIFPCNLLYAVVFAGVFVVIA